MVEHCVVSLGIEAVAVGDVTTALCVILSRSWRLVPGRLQCSAVAPDGPGEQSGGHGGGHAGKTREL